MIWLQQLLHNVDWMTTLTRFSVFLTLAIGGAILRYVWKILRGQGKATETIKTLQERVDKDEISLRALGATNDEYRRTIDAVLRSNREMHRRVEALERKVAEGEVVRRENTALKARVAELEQRVAELETINQVQVQAVVAEPVRKRGPDELLKEHL
jgi:chromosome segregation ATPase